MNKVLEGDCLTFLPKFATGSLDMIICDLPYGMTNNKWDKQEIDLSRLWLEYKRIIKPNGVIALFGQGKFTAKLIASNPVWFKYKIIWIKSRSTNFLNANKQPLRRHEDICIFYNKQPHYFPQKLKGEPYYAGFRKDNKSGNYGEFKSGECLSENGDRYPYDILAYEEDLVDFIYCKTAEFDGVFHPTQKPVDLGRWLIRTYTQSNALVLDNACGSGSFLVSAVLEGRRFIGIEKNENSFHFQQPVDFVATAKQRVKEALRINGLGKGDKS